MPIMELAFYKVEQFLVYCVAWHHSPAPPVITWTFHFDPYYL